MHINPVQLNQNYSKLNKVQQQTNFTGMFKITDERLIPENGNYDADLFYRYQEECMHLGLSGPSGVNGAVKVCKDQMDGMVKETFNKMGLVYSQYPLNGRPTPTTTFDIKKILEDDAGL